MKFVLAPDSFKGTMTAATVAATMSAGVRDVFPDAECIEVPMADGGEGTTRSLVDALGGEMRTVEVSDALGRSRTAHFGWIAAKKLAVVEIAEAAGIEHLTVEELDPHQATTVGVGQLLNHIIELSPAQVIIGLGGSATNDGGWGMAYELGAIVKNSSGNPIESRALALADAANLDTSGISERWQDVEITLACDVDNPLTGERGATAVFGPQKGVQPEEIALFDAALAQWGNLLDETSGRAVSKNPGAGAAGGLGAALMALLGAKPQRGIDVVIHAVSLEDQLAGADFVFTGEGSMDYQTKFGKTPWGVMLAARKQNIPTIAFTGNLGRNVESLHENGFAAIIPTVREVGSLTEALEKAQPSLRESVRMACRILAAARHTEKF
ncbi:glycerate kinase [Varibaculum vaginae]|uniref:glycerate kinase n=1 Tax=Varibaculum vaginae TaxID=2364797 RepID=UPI000F0982A2|nr:glycerate kinase [Varibaculum vaginae]